MSDRTASERRPDPTLIAADADVLVADLLIGDTARAAIDHVRRHSWLGLVASDALLADAMTAIEEFADADLAGDWRACIDRLRTRVEHPSDDHPGLASAYRGDATHLLSFDESLTATGTNLAVQPYAALSIRPPTAFNRLFDPEPLYEATHDDSYPGPDRDPHA
jgi:hypothetical protein